MPPVSPDKLLLHLRGKALSRLPVDFTGKVMEKVQAGGNPWLRDLRSFLFVWVPLGLALAAVLAWGVSHLPHGEHSHAEVPQADPPEEWP